MILSGNKIREEVVNKKITIEPFNEFNVSPNSYNFCLGDYLYLLDDQVLDCKKKSKLKKIIIPEDGYILEPNKLYLGYTYEKIGSDNYVPIITSRSSIMRLGLTVVNSTALVDVGFLGNLTLQLHTLLPIKIYRGMAIGQIMFFSIMGEYNLYNGKYQNSVGPEFSKMWEDMNEK